MMTPAFESLALQAPDTSFVYSSPGRAQQKPPRGGNVASLTPPGVVGLAKNVFHVWQGTERVNRIAG
jgi:hypothetical protein